MPSGARWIDGRTLQKALAHFGALPADQIDGDIGAITREALATWINNGASSRVSASVLSTYSTQPAADRRSILVTPEALAQVFEEAARAYDQRARRRTASSPSSSLSTPSLSGVATPFFRQDNPWMWGAFALAAAGFGGLLYYAKKKRWFR